MPTNEFLLELGDKVTPTALATMVQGSRNTVKATLNSITEEWENLTLYAQFRTLGSSGAVWIPINNYEGASFYIPEEVLIICSSSVYISIYGKGEDGKIIKITPWEFIGIVKSGADPGPDNPEDPPLPDDHRILSHRDDPEQHPIEAITGLTEALDAIRESIPQIMTAEEMRDILTEKES